MHIHGHETPGGFQIREDGRARTDTSKSSIFKRHIGFARHGQQVQHGIGGSARGRHAGDGVLKGLACEDVERRTPRFSRSMTIWPH
jgi:hypothetical protein